MNSSSAFERVVLIVLDGVGIGGAQDAEDYGDSGADTLGHVSEACMGLRLPHMQRLGIGNLLPLAGIPPVRRPAAAHGRMQECSVGKDTTTGHWELTGIIQERPFATFPRGFPREIIDEFVAITGLEPLGNVAASGTEIIRLLGEEHMRTGRPIVYTSADSVFQIAAHEEVISVETLYDICRQTRRMLDPYRVGRVIARPFVGSSSDDFVRTSRRHDFSFAPPGPTVLDLLAEKKLTVYGVGKIRDIFKGQGLTDYSCTKDNADGMAKTLDAFSATSRGLIFTNLVDFDMLYGHRLDTEGFAHALEAFDRWLPSMMQAMGPKDLLIVTADHGCDPTTPGSDHTREDVPVLVWHPGLDSGKDLGVRQSFADLGATVGAAFGVDLGVGEAFLDELLPKGC